MPAWSRLGISEPSGLFDRPPIRAGPIQHRVLHPGEVVPDSPHFFNFLRDHVKSASGAMESIHTEDSDRLRLTEKHIQIMYTALATREEIPDDGVLPPVSAGALLYVNWRPLTPLLVDDTWVLNP